MGGGGVPRKRDARRERRGIRAQLQPPTSPQSKHPHPSPHTPNPHPAHLGEEGPEVVELFLQRRVLLLRLGHRVPVQSGGTVGQAVGRDGRAGSREGSQAGRQPARQQQVTRMLGQGAPSLHSTAPLLHPSCPHPPPHQTPTPDLADGGVGAGADHDAAGAPRRDHSAAEQRVGLVLVHHTLLGQRHGADVLGHAAALARQDRLRRAVGGRGGWRLGQQGLSMCVAV